MAPSTPPPPSNEEFAAFTMASTARVVMSARTGISSILDILPLARSCIQRARSHRCSYNRGIDPYLGWPFATGGLSGARRHLGSQEDQMRITTAVETEVEVRSWQDYANCLGVDPDLFFPER